MCYKCAELEEKIARYRRIMERVLDAELSAGLARLIEEAKAAKTALHQEQQK